MPSNLLPDIGPEQLAAFLDSLALLAHPSNRAVAEELSANLGPYLTHLEYGSWKLAYFKYLSDKLDAPLDDISDWTIQLGFLANGLASSDFSTNYDDEILAEIASSQVATSQMKEQLNASNIRELIDLLRQQQSQIQTAHYLYSTSLGTAARFEDIRWSSQLRGGFASDPENVDTVEPKLLELFPVGSLTLRLSDGSTVVFEVSPDDIDSIADALAILERELEILSSYTNRNGTNGSSN